MELKAKRPDVLALLIVLPVSGCLVLHGQRYQDFTISTPLDASQTLVLGFMGGRDSWDDDRQGVRRLALKLRSRNLPIQVETVENQKRGLALQLVVAAFDVNQDAVLSQQEKENARLVVYGQSFGGAAVVKLARQLSREDIPVLLTVQIDSVGRNDKKIPPNVRRAANLYQSNGWVIRGQSGVRAEDPQKTEIIGNFQFNYKKKKIDTSGVHWFKKLFRVAHTKMGLDSDVWDKVEELIVEEVQGIHSAAGSRIRSGGANRKGSVLLPIRNERGSSCPLSRGRGRRYDFPHHGLCDLRQSGHFVGRWIGNPFFGRPHGYGTHLRSRDHTHGSLRSSALRAGSRNGTQRVRRLHADCRSGDSLAGGTGSGVLDGRRLPGTFHNAGSSSHDRGNSSPLERGHGRRNRASIDLSGAEECRPRGSRPIDSCQAG